MIYSWTCHVCGEERPDRSISVRVHDNSEKLGLPSGTFQENIRYCNDKESCIEGSKTHSNFKKEPVEVKEKNKVMKLKYVYTFLIFFAILMVVNPLLVTLLQDDVTFMEKFLYPTGIFLRVLIAAYFSYSFADKTFKDK